MRGISAQAQDSFLRMERLQSIRSKYQPFVESEKNSERMAAVIDFLFSQPIFNARQLADSLRMPFKTARQYIDKLGRAGIVREMTGYARNQIYRADEVFSAIDKVQD